MSDRLTTERKAEIIAHLATTTNWSLGNLAARDLVAELEAVRAERDQAQAELADVEAEREKLVRWHLEDGKSLARTLAHVAELKENLRAVKAGWSVSRARVAELENALAATGRSLSSFIFDSDDPGTDALGAQWLYHQATPKADDPFAQPRAFRSRVFSEASKAVENMDGQAPDGHSERPQAYRDGYSDGLLDAAERLEKLADQAAEGSDQVFPPQHYDKVPDPADGCHWCACGNRWPCKTAEEAAR